MLFRSERRPLLHAGAAAALVLLLGSVMLARETIAMAVLGAGYALAWLLTWYRLAWRP